MAIYRYKISSSGKMFNYSFTNSTIIINRIDIDLSELVNIIIQLLNEHKGFITTNYYMFNSDYVRGGVSFQTKKVNCMFNSTKLVIVEWRLTEIYVNISNT